MSEQTPKRKYDKTFKEDAVRLVTEKGKSVTEVARNLGIHPANITRWKRTYLDRKDVHEKGYNLDELLEENKKLKRELVDVKEDREILKKATAFFSKHQK